jgi:hypothetical protein
VNAKGTGPNADGVDALREAFAARLDDVISDRNGNRAHAYERSVSSETATILGVTELAARFTYVEGLLNDLQIVCEGATLRYTEMNALPAERAVPHLVDLILLGRCVEDRAAIYERLHAEDDTHSATLFNAYDAIRKARGAAG